MCLEIWIMRIAVSNVVSDYVGFARLPMDVRCSLFVVVVVVVRHTQKILPIVHAAAGARACLSNGIWRICDFDFWHEKSI